MALFCRANAAAGRTMERAPMMMARWPHAMSDDDAKVRAIIYNIIIEAEQKCLMIPFSRPCNAMLFRLPCSFLRR